ncbi:hypothetical protein PVAND_015160 [Polypedilum vanderplanki]|uniref:GRAM domain-containing protein n=1 Tax=Polypedilum vanderplanki TaxID=319348 RepID=A0A9J6BC85_POLVA|nr:hypothetical protein PVAND_015160 [Polypedilum vanderplanki]
MHKQRLYTILKFYSMTFRDYLLHPSTLAPSSSPPKTTKIGKNGSNDTPKSEKKEKKIKKIPQMSDSRIKKFQKIFNQKIPPDEKLINYFSCALVADILLQGHLYVSENFFSFYSNVFGYVTKLVIPISSVTFISKEKTAKMFPNAIGIQLDDAKHVFGSFISRETAYQLMIGMTKKLSQIEGKNDCVDGMKEEEDEEEVEAEEIQSSKDDSSSLSSETQLSQDQKQLQQQHHHVINPPPPQQQQHTPKYEAFQSSTFIEPQINSKNNQNHGPQKVLFIGIALTLILAFFTAFLLLKINALEKETNSGSYYHRDYSQMTIEEAENALNRNLMTVRSVRRKLEELQTILQKNFNESPHEHEL